jgi:hypothetical protein
VPSRLVESTVSVQYLKTSLNPGSRRRKALQFLQDFDQLIETKPFGTPPDEQPGKLLRVGIVHVS